MNKALIVAYKTTKQLLHFRKTVKTRYTECTLIHFSPFDIQGFVPETRVRTKYVTIYFCLKMPTVRENIKYADVCRKQ